MTFPIFKPLQPTTCLSYPSPAVPGPGFDQLWDYLASRPDQYQLVEPYETKIAAYRAVASRNFVTTNAVVVRSYFSYPDPVRDIVMMIHDSGLPVDPSWDERIEAPLKYLLDGTPYLILIQHAAMRRITTGLVTYLIERGVRTRGEIAVNSSRPFHVIYWPREDQFAIQGGDQLFTYPGFFSA